jgi:hypothetical protein
MCAMDLLVEEFAPELESEDSVDVNGASWFAWSPAPRPDLPRANRSPLNANRDWLRVMVPTPE